VCLEGKPISVGEEYDRWNMLPPKVGFQNDTFPSYKEEIDV